MRKVMNLESYIKGLSGVTNILRPFKSKCCHIHKKENDIGLSVRIWHKDNAYNFMLEPKLYNNEDDLISAMWTFACQVWAQMNTENNKGTKHG